MVLVSSFTCATNMVVVLLTISKHVCIVTTYINIILSAITVNIFLSDNNHQQFTLVWWKI